MHRQSLSVEICLAVLSASLYACSSGRTTVSNSSTPPEVVPLITVQPSSQSVPMGLAATFAVTAIGQSLAYQWSKDGSPLVGATGSSYTTPATTLADTGATFLVTVSNSGGSVTSSAASLTITARAPAQGDLRFQQVDSGSTVNGWGNVGVGLSTSLLARAAQYYASGLGTAFYVGSQGNCGPPAAGGATCSWFFSVAPLISSTAMPVLTTGYASDQYSNFANDLASPNWPNFGNAISPAASQSVVSSLDLEQSACLFALSWVQSTQQGAFLPVQNTVTADTLQAAVAQEGASGRVVTAISANGSSITYIAYSWLADANPLYDTEAVTTAPNAAAAAAGGLAAEGYIITASGRADDSGNIVIVGTRVHGDSLPRPMITAQGSQAIKGLQEQGYAIVGVIEDLSASNPYTFVGER
jgi:hypothetical protein